jgi:hypothetical protein
VLRVIYSVRTKRGDTAMQMTETGETIFKFNTFGRAKGFTDHATKIMMIILGDDMLFWVVTPAHATRLVSQGYELAE